MKVSSLLINIVVGLTIYLPQTSNALPIYFEGVVSSSELSGEVQTDWPVTRWNIETSWLAQGAFINGVLDIDDAIIAEFDARGWPFYTTRDGIANYRYPGIGVVDGFVQSRIPDRTDSNIDVLSYGQPDEEGSVFFVQDLGIEAFSSNWAKRFGINLSVASGKENFIDSLIYEDLAFEIFAADEFEGTIHMDTYYYNNFRSDEPRANVLDIEFDLTYLRVGTRQAIAQKVSAPNSLGILSLAGGLAYYLRRRLRRSA